MIRLLDPIISALMNPVTRFSSAERRKRKLEGASSSSCLFTYPRHVYLSNQITNALNLLLHILTDLKMQWLTFLSQSDLPS